MNAIENLLGMHENSSDPGLLLPLSKSPSPNMDAQVTLQESRFAEKKDLLEKQIELFSKKFESKDSRLDFSVDAQTDSLIVRVVDATTGKVIRQIPPEELLAIRKYIETFIGSHVDRVA